MFDIKLFGKNVLSFGKTLINVNAAIRWLESVWDGTDSKVNKGNAYPRHVWVYSCVNAIARNVSQVPFKLYKQNTDNEVTSGPAWELFRNPSPILSRFQLWEGTEIYKQIRGGSFWHLVRGGANVTEIEFLDPNKMKPVLTDGMISMWKFTNANGREIPLLPEDLVHFKFFNPNDPFRGLSPLTAAMLGIEIDDDARRFDRNVLRNGTYPGSLVEAPERMTDEEYTRFKQSLKIENQGIGKAGRIMVLEGGAKFKEIKITAQELQFMERKKMAREETASVYKVPPIEIGIFEDANRANAQVQTKMFWTKNLIPEMRYIEDVLNTNFFPQNFPGIEGKFDISAIKELAQDLKVASETAERFYRMGVPLSEINRRMNLGFDLDRIPWKDTVLVPFNMVPITDIVSGAAQTPPDNTQRMQRFLEYAKGVKVVKNKVIPENEKKYYIHWKRFIQRLNPLINPFQSKLSRFIFEARQTTLEKFTDLVKTVKAVEVDQIFDKGDELKKLTAASAPSIMAAIKEGGQDVFEELLIEGTFDLTDARTVDYFNNQLLKLANITDNLSAEINLTLQEGVRQGLTNADIVEALKHDFNVAGNRARTIARTEIVSAANGGRVHAYIENGVDQHEWVNSFDADVRDEHRFTEIVNVGEEFSNGLKWPGDKDGTNATPENIINCRCTTIAIIK